MGKKLDSTISIENNYNRITELLKTELDVIPELRIVTGRSWFGLIEKTTFRYTDAVKWRISVNREKYNHYGRTGIIETICHELAHITHMNHSVNHSRLTALYMLKCCNAKLILLSDIQNMYLSNPPKIQAQKIEVMKQVLQELKITEKEGIKA